MAVVFLPVLTNNCIGECVGALVVGCMVGECVGALVVGCMVGE